MTWGLAVAIGGLVAWFGARRMLARSAGGPRWIPLLVLARAGAVALLVALLFDAPAGRARPLAPLVAIDRSASWRRAAGDSQAALTAWRRVVADSVRHYAPADAPLSVFGDSVRDGSLNELASLVPNDQRTLVRGTVDRAAALGRPLLLVTDGLVDDPEALADVPPGSRVVRIATSMRRDVALADLSIPLSATAGDSMAIGITVVAGGAVTPEGRVRLRLDGRDIGRTELPALAPFASTRVTVPAVVPRGATTALLEAIAEVASDVEAGNDTVRAALDILDRPAAVFVSTAPDLDVREALTVLRGALDIPTRAYLRVAPGQWRVEGSLQPIAEAEVLARARAAGMLVVHGDTAWGAPWRTGARALWVPAPPTAMARAGETVRAAEWYVTGVPRSPLAAPLSGVPFDSLPPITTAGPVRRGAPVLTTQLGKRGDTVAAVSVIDRPGAREVLISGSGYAGWSMRGGRSGEAFTALWGAIFDWLSSGRGDTRAARPAAAFVRAGEPIVWRRGGADSVVSMELRRRGAAASDRVRLVFASSETETRTAPLPAGVYDVRTAGGSALVVVNASREWLPRVPAGPTGVRPRRAGDGDVPRLRDAAWPFVVILLLLSAEWVGRRFSGQH